VRTNGIEAPVIGRRARLLVTLAAIAAFGVLARVGAAQRYLPAASPGFPRLKYADSLISLNDRCIVRKAKLNPKVRPVYVNWRPVGFC
jgi:hypothetical protein